jgi:hypothetical protein
MKGNVGSVDRWIRIIAGLIIVVAGLVFKTYWGLIGIVPIATGLLRWCPLYCPFKISTAKKGK